MIIKQVLYNGAVIIRIIGYVAIFILFAIGIYDIYQESKKIKKIKRETNKVLPEHCLKLTNAISDIILYTSAIFCIFTKNIIGIWIAVVIGIVLNGIVYSKYIQQIKGSSKNKD